MKKGLVGMMCTLGVVLLGVCSVFAESANVLSDEVSVAVFPKEDNERVMIPLRDVYSRAGYDISWDGETGTVRLSKDFKSVVYTIGDDSVVVDNQRKNLDVVPKILDGKTYVSIDSVAKGLGSEVRYDEDANMVKFKKGRNKKANWESIVSLEKTYQSSDDSGKILASVKIAVPQVENPLNRESLDKINEYYRNELKTCFDEYKKLLPSDVVSHMGKEIKYDTSYVITYNACDILSVVMINKNKTNAVVKCDVFDAKTGDKLALSDVIKIDNENKFKLDAIGKCLDKDESVKVNADDIMFYIDDGQLCLVLNKGNNVLEYRVDATENRALFRKNLQNVFNYDEEIAAKKVACDNCRERVRFVDKTIFDQHECYVFKKCSSRDGKMLAVDKFCEVIYTLENKNGEYIILDKKNVSNMISNREALEIVRRSVDNAGYVYNLDGNMSNDENGHVYSVVSVRDLDGSIDKKIAVSKIDKSLYRENRKILAKLDVNDDGTVKAVGHFEVDNNLTDTSLWGRMYLQLGSKMTIKEDGTGVYTIVGTEHFRLVNEDGKTYIEITDENDMEILPKGTRFLVEVKEIDDEKYLYLHDEEGNDVQPGNKYWKLVVDELSVFEPLANSRI